jgi:hypothetical protein
MSPSGDTSPSPLEISASTPPLPFQLTDGSCLWTILQQPIPATLSVLGARRRSLCTELTVGARNPADNQWLCGFF